MEKTTTKFKVKVASCGRAQRHRWLLVGSQGKHQEPTEAGSERMGLLGVFLGDLLRTLE